MLLQSHLLLSELALGLHSKRSVHVSMQQRKQTANEELLCCFGPGCCCGSARPHSRCQVCTRLLHVVMHTLRAAAAENALVGFSAHSAGAEQSVCGTAAHAVAVLITFIQKQAPAPCIPGNNEMHSFAQGYWIARVAGFCRSKWMSAYTGSRRSRNRGPGRTCHFSIKNWYKNGITPASRDHLEVLELLPTKLLHTSNEHPSPSRRSTASFASPLPPFGAAVAVEALARVCPAVGLAAALREVAAGLVAPGQEAAGCEIHIVPACAAAVHVHRRRLACQFVMFVMLIVS